MKIKLNDLAKAAGFKGIGEVAEYSSVTTQTLRNLFKNDPLKFRTTIQGAAINKLNEALRGVGE
jgi:hypothetical protein